MMPRGDNPNSRANLKRPSSKEARENGKKGGIASGETRAALKSFQQLDKENTTDEERLEMLANLKERAKTDNKAWELYATYMGMKPSDKLEVAAVDPEAENRLAEAIRKRRSDAETDK